MSRHAQGQYVVGGDADAFWRGVVVKTLAGAKAAATRAYGHSVGQKLQIAIVRGEQYQVVAVKHGHGPWGSA